MPRKLKSAALRSDAVTIANIPNGEITAAKLHDTAIQDKLGYTPASATTVATQLATLVDSAPATLDTLNELAAALGDDANFATTVTNSIANKVDKINITGATVGSSTAIPVLTYNAQGQITTTSTASINLSTKVDKAGDTMTGNLTISKVNPAIYLKDTADEGVDVAIGAFGENFYVFEPEDNSGTLTPDNASRQWLRIEDDADAYLMGTRKIWHNAAMPKPVTKVSHYENGSMITIGNSSNVTFFTFDVQKISSTSLLYITGNMPTSGSDNHGLYYFVSFNGTRKFRGISDSLRSHGSPSGSTPGMMNINSVSQSGISAGTVTIGLGWQPLDGGGNRPFHYINPDSSVDGRNISGTVITVWEVEQ